MKALQAIKENSKAHKTKVSDSHPPKNGRAIPLTSRDNLYVCVFTSHLPSLSLFPPQQRVTKSENPQQQGKKRSSSPTVSILAPQPKRNALGDVTNNVSASSERFPRN